MHINNDVVEAIGNTPLIKLKRASEETGCTILGKAEFMNPGGSVKDRAGLNAQKLCYAHAHSPVGDFLSAIKDIKPTAIIGVAAVGGFFFGKGFFFGTGFFFIGFFTGFGGGGAGVSSTVTGFGRICCAKPVVIVGSMLSVVGW